MSDEPLAEAWPTHCPECGTALQQATVDLDETNRDDPEFQAGEMVRVDFCPNPDCPTHAGSGPGPTRP